MQAQIDILKNALASLETELQDNIGQLLSSTKMLLGVTEKNMNPVPDTLLVAEATLAKAIQDLRGLSYAKTKNSFPSFDLIHSLERSAGRLHDAYGTTISIRSNKKQLPIHSAEQAVIFCILQDLLRISINQRQANEIDLRIIWGKTQLRINTAINSCRSRGKADAQKDAAFLHLYQRISMLNGMMQWKNNKAAGASIHITLPLNKENT